ncbi:hypothetical protein JCM14719A_11740 [Calditerricola satsumensis]
MGPPPASIVPQGKGKAGRQVLPVLARRKTRATGAYFTVTSSVCATPYGVWS